MKTIALSKIAEVFNGKTPSKSEQQCSGHPVLKVKDLTALGEFRGSLDSFVTEGFAAKYHAKWAQAGDTVILNAAHNASHVASKAGLLGPEVQGALLTGEWLVVRPTTGVDAQYVHYWLTSPTVRRKLKDSVKGIHLYPRDVAALAIPLPELSEQRRIAAILDHADALRAKRRQVLAHLDTLTQSIYFYMFDTRRWATASLVSLARSPDDIKCGPFGTQLQVSEFRSEGVPLLGIRNVNARFTLPPFEFLEQGTADRLTAYNLRPGDIVMTRKGTIGNCAIYPAESPPGVMHSDLLRLRVDENSTNVVYLEHHLQLSRRVSHQIAMMSPGAVMPGINVTKLKQLEVETPPLALQREFAARIGAISRLRTGTERALAAEDELFASLQSRAFRGEL